MSKLAGLKPEKVFEYFEYLSSVPHGSGNTDAIAGLIVSYAKEHNFRYIHDQENNVIIFAPGTKGYENKEPVILQGHMDMVCAVKPGSGIDMSVTPIDIYTEDGYVKAKDTSLGGDDIVACAIALAIMDSDDVAHPPIEAVFTSDEETGMDGAVSLDASILKSRRMINLDSEEEGVITAGCAGGARAYLSIPVQRTKITSEFYTGYRLKISGLTGGHSGCDIDKGRVNANVLMSRMLFYVSSKILILIDEFKGGKFDNVITEECEVSLFVPNGRVDQFVQMIQESFEIYKNEYKTVEKNLVVSVEKFEYTTAQPVCVRGSVNIASSMFLLPNGIQEMSMDIKGLVQTSLNPGVSYLGQESFDFSYCVRSSIETQKKMILDKLRLMIGYLGGNMIVANSYPGWQFASDSPLRDLFVETYRELTGREMAITATHGGLECGLFVDKLNGIDCVSVGPEMHDIHSPAERLSIASVERLYELVCRVLARM